MIKFYLADHSEDFLILRYSFIRQKTLQASTFYILDILMLHLFNFIAIILKGKYQKETVPTIDLFATMFKDFSQRIFSRP